LRARRDFRSNGGGELCAFDCRDVGAGRILMVPLILLDLRGGVIADSFGEFAYGSLPRYRGQRCPRGGRAGGGIAGVRGWPVGVGRALTGQNIERPYDRRRVPSALSCAVAAVNHAPKYSRICCNSRSLAVQWRAWHGAYNGKVLRPATSVSTTVSRGRVRSASLPHSGQVTGNWIIVSLMAYQSRVCERRFQLFFALGKGKSGQDFC
jgi:hypothetical protein